MSETPEPRMSSGGAGWFLAGYGGVAGFILLEAATRRRGSASSLDASADDRGTTRLIVAAYVTAAIAAPLVRMRRRPQLPRAAGPIGAGIEVAGLGLRAWSMRTLGGSYSRTLRVERAQHVVDRGPYRFVRHPGYAGSLMIWTGFALTSRSVRVVEVVGGLLGYAYHRRVGAEEALLRRDLPGYIEYSRRTKRLIPFVW
ncbi:MAG: isoprenylcysteine carboxylmethyltransferase family protein [Candidatus Dormiibacterota bacterium]